MKGTLKTVLVLTVIAVFSGLVLGLVSYLTKVPEADQIKNKLSLVYENTDDLEDLKIETVKADNVGEVSNAFKSKDNTYVMLATGIGGYGGDVKILIAIKENKIINLASFENSETPGLGSKAFLKEYYQQYLNKDISKFDSFVLAKNSATAPNEIDKLTGATFTSKALKNAVNIAVYEYKKLTNQKVQDIEQISAEMKANLAEAANTEFDKLKKVDFKANSNDDGTVTDVYKIDDTYVLVAEGNGGFKGKIQLFVAVKNNEILNIVVGENRETRERSAFDKSHLQQYFNKDVRKFDKNDFDVVTKATRTSNGINNAVKSACNNYEKLISEGK